MEKHEVDKALQALAEEAAYQKGWEDAMASLKATTTGAPALVDEIRMRQGAQAILDPTSHAPRPSINDLAAWVLLLIDYRYSATPQQQDPSSARQVSEAQQEPEGEEVYLRDLPEWPTRTEVINEATVARDTVVPVDVAGLAYEYIGKVRARVQPRRVEEETLAQALLLYEDELSTLNSVAGRKKARANFATRIGIEITPTEEEDG